MKPITKLLLGAVITVAALACYPAIAHADEDSYLAAVSAAGLLSADNTPSVALALGHQICNDITAHGVAGVADTMGLARQSGITPRDAGHMLRFSVENLCPDNRGATDAWINDPNASFDPLPGPMVGSAAGQNLPPSFRHLQRV